MLAAQAVLCRLISGKSRILKIAELHPQARACLFGDADEKLKIAWVPDLGDNLQFRISDSRLSAIDIMGGPISQRVSPLTEAPVRIVDPATLSAEQFLGSIKLEMRL